MVSGKLLYSTGSSARLLCDDLEVWDGGVGEKRLKREGICVYLQLTHVVQQKLTQHCKAITLHLKKKKQIIVVGQCHQRMLK